jgi:DNA polymerase-1
LRKYTYTHFIRKDLIRVLEESEYPDIKLPERTLHVGSSYLDILCYLGRCSIASTIGVDIEVVNEEVSCISFALTPWDCMSIPFLLTGRGHYMSPPQEMEVWKRIAAILEDERIQKVGQNFIFDTSFLYRKYGIKTRNVECTMIQTGTLTPDFPKGLDFITSIWTKEPYYKDEGKKYFKQGADDITFWRYNAKDSAVCLEAYPKMLNDLTKQGNLHCYEMQRRLIEPLMYMQERGMLIDVDGMKKQSVEAEAKIESLKADLFKLCGFPINMNSPKQLANYFYNIKHFKPFFKDGKITTDINALKRLSRSGCEEAAIMMQLRKWGKLKSTYYDMRISPDGRLRSAMNPIGTNEGRLSSSIDIFGYGGNTQNLPGAFKRHIKADPGCVMYDIDLSGADARVVAMIAPEMEMARAFNEGLDLHRLTFSKMFGVPYDEVSDEPGSSSLGLGVYSQRFWGKKSVHSFNYSLSGDGFALRFETTVKEGRMIRDRYLSAYPGIKRYWAWVQAKLARDHTLENPFGRKRLFLDRWGDDMFRKAYAFIPASTVADKINHQGIIFIYYNQQTFKHVEIMNQVHDSIVIQIPINVGWEYHAMAINQILGSLSTPVEWRGGTFVIPADVKMGLNLYDMEKVKKASIETLPVIYDKLVADEIKEHPINDADLEVEEEYNLEDADNTVERY